MLAGVTSAEYVEFPGGAGEEPSGGDGAGREEPLVRIHSGPKCIVVVVILLAASGGVAECLEELARGGGKLEIACGGTD